MTRRRELAAWQVVAVYALGVAAGAQVALYLFDLYDDGVAEPLSGAIGGAMVVAGLAVIGVLFRPRRDGRRAREGRRGTTD